MKKKQIRNPQKKGLKNGLFLCYSVNEANCRFRLDFTRVSTAFSDRQNILLNKGFDIRRRHIATTTEKVSANLDSNGKVGLIAMFSRFLLDDYIEGDHLTEIIHNQSCEYLLGNVLRLFSVETG